MSDNGQKTIRHFLFPDELDRYEAALNNGHWDSILEVYHGTGVDDPIQMFPDTSRDMQAQQFYEGVKAYAGGFVRALVEAYRAGDMINRQRIRRTWPEYWIKYVIFGQDQLDKEKGSVCQSNR